MLPGCAQPAGARGGSLLSALPPATSGPLAWARVTEEDGAARSRPAAPGAAHSSPNSTPATGRGPQRQLAQGRAGRGRRWAEPGAAGREAVGNPAEQAPCRGPAPRLLPPPASQPGGRGHPSRGRKRKQQTAAAAVAVGSGDPGLKPVSDVAPQFSCLTSLGRNEPIRTLGERQVPALQQAPGF